MRKRSTKQDASDAAEPTAAARTNWTEPRDGFTIDESLVKDLIAGQNDEQVRGGRQGLPDN